MLTEKLFGAIHVTEHGHSWDYTAHERALTLLDVNKKYFALITTRREIDDETGAMSDFRDTSQYQGYLFSKRNPRPVKVDKGSIPLRYKYGELWADKQEDLVATIEKKTGASGTKERRRIAVNGGRVHISRGNLIFDKM